MTSTRDRAQASADEAFVLRSLGEHGCFGSETVEFAVTRLPGGHSHVTWLVSTAGADGQPRSRYVVKVAQPDGPLAPYDVAREAAFTDLARRVGVATARVVAVVQESSLGAPYFVTEFVPGDVPTLETLSAWLGGYNGSTASELMREMLRIQARLAEAGQREPSIGDMTAHYRIYVDHAAQALAEVAARVIQFPESVELARQALSDRAGFLAGSPAALVHGDFRPGNFVLPPDGRPNIVAVLDWERAMWGHPLHDLGYLCLPTMRRDGRIAGLVTEEKLAALWHDVTGTDLDLYALGYFTALSIYTELCACLRALLTLGGPLDLLRIVPLVAEHEKNLMTILRKWDSEPAS
jgi:aminoglycoside phosphotransferase (APT) family kinase protein